MPVLAAFRQIPFAGEDHGLLESVRGRTPELFRDKPLQRPPPAFVVQECRQIEKLRMMAASAASDEASLFHPEQQGPDAADRERIFDLGLDFFDRRAAPIVNDGRNLTHSREQFLDLGGRPLFNRAIVQLAAHLHQPRSILLVLFGLLSCMTESDPSSVAQSTPCRHPLVMHGSDRFRERSERSVMEIGCKLLKGEPAHLSGGHRRPVDELP